MDTVVIVKVVFGPEGLEPILGVIAPVRWSPSASGRRRQGKRAATV
jgi:hypothetical protein